MHWGFGIDVCMHRREVGSLHASVEIKIMVCPSSSIPFYATQFLAVDRYSESLAPSEQLLLRAINCSTSSLDLQRLERETSHLLGKPRCLSCTISGITRLRFRILVTYFRHMEYFPIFRFFRFRLVCVPHIIVAFISAK